MQLFRTVFGTRQGRIAVGVAAVPLLALAWWLGSPLFLDRTVDEAFPLSAGAEAPPGMTQADVEKEMASAAAEDHPMHEAMSEGMAGAAPLKQGSFRDADRFHQGSGEAVLYRLPDGPVVLRLEDLRVTNGPDLHVLLSAHAGPASRAEVMDGGYLDLGSLKGNIGSQNYPLPAGTDISLYDSVVIYCMPFHVVFSVAPLGAA